MFELYLLNSIMFFYIFNRLVDSSNFMYRMSTFVNSGVSSLVILSPLFCFEEKCQSVCANSVDPDQKPCLI